MSVTPDLLSVLLLGYLHKNCCGRATARSQRRITRDLRGLGLAVDVRAVRDALGRLVQAGWPVGTSCSRPPGAYLCSDRADFAAAYRNLVERVRVQAARCRRFRAIGQEVLTGQRRLDFGEAREAFADLEAAPLLAGAGARP